MTTVYFVRHAQPNYNNHDDPTRELTEKGMADRQKVTAFFLDKDIHAIYSSPYKRAVDTVKHFADTVHLPIVMEADFRERKVREQWIEGPEFQEFSHRQWADRNYKLPDGESLNEAQRRNVSALRTVLQKHPGENVVIGSHGTALCSVIAYYDPGFGHSQSQDILARMPLIVRFTFEGSRCLEIKQFTI